MSVSRSAASAARRPRPEASSRDARSGRGPQSRPVGTAHLQRCAHAPPQSAVSDQFQIWSMCFALRVDASLYRGGAVAAAGATGHGMSRSCALAAARARHRSWCCRPADRRLYRTRHDVARASLCLFPSQSGVLPRFPGLLSQLARSRNTFIVRTRRRHTMSPSRARTSRTARRGRRCGTTCPTSPRRTSRSCSRTRRARTRSRSPTTASTRTSLASASRQRPSTCAPPLSCRSRAARPLHRA